MGVIAQYAVSEAQPAVVSGPNPGITAKYFADFPVQSNWVAMQGVNGLIANTQQGQVPTDNSNAGGLPVPGRSILDGQRFRIQASGTIFFAIGDASGSNPNFPIQIKISSQSPNVAPQYSTLFALNCPQAFDGVTYPWSLAIDLEGDSTTGILQGTSNGLFDGVLTFTAGLSTTAITPVTGVNFVQEPAFVAVCAVVFPTSATANRATLSEFKVVQA